MKKVISLLLASLLTLSMASCSASGGIMDGFGNNMASEGDYNASLKGDVIAPGAPAEDAVEDEEVPDGNTFETIVENPFASVSESPISTFSADVDTASYTMLRKMIGMGYSLKEIQSAAGKGLRTEELLNYFSYQGNLPGENELFGVTPVIAPCPWNQESMLLTLTLKTAATIEKTANNLVFLIDVSGSMNSEDKIDLLKKSFTHLVETLGEDDVVSIVTYSGAERVVLEGCPGNRKDEILRAVNTLDVGGSTNGEAGIRKAYEIAEANFLRDGNNRIIMASDGDLNVGIRSPEELKKLVEEKRESGTYLSVLGFGYGNYRDSNMEALADCGNGVYYYIDGEVEAEKVFGTDLISTLYAVAEDVKLQITFDPEAVSEYRLIGYENRLLSTEDFDDDTKDAGEVGAGHSVTVCYELKLTENAMQKEDWMTLDIRYKEPGETQSKENNYTIGSGDAVEETDSDYALICGLIVLSMVIRDSEYLPQGWTASNAVELLAGVQTDTDGYRAELIQMVKNLK